MNIIDATKELLADGAEEIKELGKKLKSLPRPNRAQIRKASRPAHQNVFTKKYKSKKGKAAAKAAHASRRKKK